MRHIYNTTFIVEERSEREWVAYMQEHYLSSISSSGLPTDMIFTKVSIDQPEGKTYSLQLVFSSEQALNHFLNQHLSAAEETLLSRYKDHYLCFSSILTEI